MKPTEIVASFVTETSFGDIPEEAFTKGKWALLDIIAAAFAGFQHKMGKEIISFVKELGGTPTSTILGDGYQTSAPWAAYVNGTLCHAIDYDDINHHLGGHPTAPVFPAILAVGEKARASGKEILLAYVLGVEVECKLGLAVNKTHYHIGWHPTATLGTFGATAACGKLVNLTKDQTMMALGLAGSQASALKQNFGTMTKPLHVGQTAKNGVLSALLASRGWTADREILEGHFGFCNVFAGRGVYDLRAMTENLGKPFDVQNPGIQLKKYPCCGSIHPTLDAILMLLEDKSLRPEKVEWVECEISPERIHVLVHPNPKSGLEGKFSLEYCLATAILKGKVSLADFTEEKVGDKQIQSFLPRIKVLQRETLSPFSVRLRVQMKDGQIYEVKGDRSPGITTREELATKYRDCLEWVLPPAQIDRSFQIIQELEKVKDISELIKSLVIVK